MDGDQLPKVPGIRFASLGTHAAPIKLPDAKGWTPAVGYDPFVARNKQISTDREMVPPAARKLRKARVRGPHRIIRHTNFRFVIGVHPGW